MQDACEEPGFPSLSSTPRSIRNMENILERIDREERESLSHSPGKSPPLSPTSPRAEYAIPGSPRKVKSMSGRDVWHLGKGTAGPRSYGSYSKITKDKYDSVKPGGATVWDHILKSEQSRPTVPK